MDLLYGIKSLLFGVAVGAALGVPVEYTEREQLRTDPVTEMRGFRNSIAIKGGVCLHQQDGGGYCYFGRWKADLKDSGRNEAQRGILFNM